MVLVKLLTSPSKLTEPIINKKPAGASKYDE